MADALGRVGLDSVASSKLAKSLVDNGFDSEDMLVHAEDAALKDCGFNPGQLTKLKSPSLSLAPLPLPAHLFHPTVRALQRDSRPEAA